MTNWSAPTSSAEAYRRAGGRRRYNALRRADAISRRFKLMFEWAQHPELRRADLARRYGVSRATITRDIAWLKMWGDLRGRCQVCGHKLPKQAPMITQIAVISELKHSFEHIFD